MDDTAQPTTLTRHQVFYRVDGDICLIAKNTVFRLSRSQLAEHSSFFSDLFKFSVHSPDIEHDGAAVIHLYDEPEDLATVFGFLFREPVRPFDFIELCITLKVATKYMMEPTRGWCLEVLSNLRRMLFNKSSLVIRLEGDRADDPAALRQQHDLFHWERSDARVRNYHGEGLDHILGLRWMPDCNCQALQRSNVQCMDPATMDQVCAFQKPTPPPFPGIEIRSSRQGEFARIEGPIRAAGAVIGVPS
ncbi:hypothetical protein FRB95_013656 [Tulasnella sp. JGI-2019a]|nr:hypothetical protein FRB95_013656 [Tulasnella sp. JGI-2019a]